jgi:hypothetical protein
MKLHRPATLMIAATGALAFAVSVGQPAANAAVHFATPLSATRYFAAAVDEGDMTALHQVTTPGSFKQVMGMRGGVRDVRAQSCTATGRGDYDCSMSYQFRKQGGTGYWNVIVAPAVNPGWYVYQYQLGGCD